MSDITSGHYDKKYFDWQSTIGEFGGWANSSKFEQYITADSKVLDFGCGGGYLLNNLKCAKKVGVEVNRSAAEIAVSNGVEVYFSAAEVPDNYVDIIISNNALEHTLQPYQELVHLYRILKTGGKIIFVVPCETIRFSYKNNDIHQHLYSWSPSCIGNLFSNVGFSVIESKPYIHKWPPKYKLIAKLVGRNLFEVICRIYGRIETSWFQVRLIAEKRSSGL